MSYAEQVRDPSLALNSQQDNPEKSNGMNWWKWFLILLIVKVILIAIFRPQWLAKLGIHFGGSVGLGGIANPNNWV